MWFSKLSLGLLALAALSTAQYTGPCSASACGATSKYHGMHILDFKFERHRTSTLAAQGY
ncbi:hypothetical protein B0T22DRAFT_485809 [Podospora appendiculata]|uniref:Uncharacterized protein n=1 Tax=Podospora appendiculata TaxID=314037 RepID=A0AAE0WYY6_9PEZI|nr:hypothetical protein B0T22DRAFT_485809 [Podospora appendiculata]